MVETIAPVVYGSRSRYLRAVLLHAVAASASAGLFGAAAGLLGMAFGAPWGRVGAASLVAVAALYVAREVVGLPVPTLDRKQQVPDWWRTFYAPELAVVMYGAGLGIGFLTFLGHGTFVVVTALAAASGDPLIGALLVAPFGVARGLSVLIVVRTRDEEGPADLVARLSSIGTRWWRRGANATACALVAALALTSCSNPELPASTSPNPEPRTVRCCLRGASTPARQGGVRCSDRGERVGGIPRVRGHAVGPQRFRRRPLPLLRTNDRSFLRRFRSLRSRRDRLGRHRDRPAPGLGP